MVQNKGTHILPTICLSNIKLVTIFSWFCRRALERHVVIFAPGCFPSMCSEEAKYMCLRPGDWSDLVGFVLRTMDTCTVDGLL